MLTIDIDDDSQRLSQQSSVSHKSRWPRTWRPYAALLSGFCGMANCWSVPQRSLTPRSCSRMDADRCALRGLIMSFGTFFRYYDERLLLGATDTAVGLIGGVQAFMVLLLSLIVGRLLDAKFHQFINGAGGLWTCLGYFSLGCSMEGLEDEGRYGLIILTQSIIAGVGMSCFFSHSSHCAIQVRKESAQGNVFWADIFVEWFPNHKYFAVGITSAGAAVGEMRYISSRMRFPLTDWQEDLHTHWQSPILSPSMAFPQALRFSPQYSVQSLRYPLSAVLPTQQQISGQ